MKFTSSRKLVLAGMGHVVTFQKGDTLFVPPILHQEALAQGLEPEDGSLELRASKAPDDSSRVEAITTAMKMIAERNSADDFDAAGIPKVRAIEALTGGVKPADNKERLALWAEVLASVGT